MNAHYSSVLLLLAGCSYWLARVCGLGVPARCQECGKEREKHSKDCSIGRRDKWK